MLASVPPSNTFDAPLLNISEIYHGGDVCPFHNRLAAKLARRETVDVTVIGGSVAYGSDLGDIPEERWSHRLEDVLNSGWYEGEQVYM